MTPRTMTRRGSLPKSSTVWQTSGLKRYLASCTARASVASAVDVVGDRENCTRHASRTSKRLTLLRWCASRDSSELLSRSCLIRSRSRSWRIVLSCSRFLHRRMRLRMEVSLKFCLCLANEQVLARKLHRFLHYLAS